MSAYPSKNLPTPYPFGSSLKTRAFSARSGFRFGFNTQEKDKEAYNNNETYTATFWEYDGRLGRRWNVDPKSLIDISCFAVLGNNPIWHIDIMGDTIKITPEGYEIINEGLNSTLGENHGFKYHSEKGIITYSKLDEVKYSNDQQSIILRYTTLINSAKNTNVAIVDYYEKIRLMAKSLADSRRNAVTITIDFQSFNVFIARDPKEVIEVPSSQITQHHSVMEVKMISEIIDANKYYRGVASMHEIGGHAFLRLTEPNLTQNEHDNLVESFETNFRQFYKIGTYNTDRELKKANRNGLKVKIGDPKYLGCESAEHPKQ